MGNCELTLAYRLLMIYHGIWHVHIGKRVIETNESFDLNIEMNIIDHDYHEFTQHMTVYLLYVIHRIF